MDADTKRGAVWVTVDAKHNGVMVTLDSLREQLATQSLHVVTAAEKAVLDAMARVTIRQDGDGHCSIPGIEWEEPLRAELARREAAK